MRLKPGVRVDDAVHTMRDLAIHGDNARNERAFADQHINAYLDWVDAAETKLRGMFVDFEVVDELHSRRYWNIVRFDAPQYTTKLVQRELEHQIPRLREVADQLERLARLRDRGGFLIVPDTNVMLHCQAIDKIKWREIANRAGGEPLRLVLTLQVLDEIDNKRYADSEKIRRKAKNAIRPLVEREAALKRSGFAPIDDKGVGATTVEYHVDGPSHRRRPDPDEEILDRTEFLAQITELPTCAITRDHGMLVRADARGIDVRMMPDKYLTEPH